MININIHVFARKFVEEYNFLYNAYPAYIPGYNEAVAEFDELLAIPWGKEFIREFVRYRGDAISSDREAAAFMFALASLGG